jgi:hypothetical protein
MAVTVSRPVVRNTAGKLREIVYDVTGPGSYTTGGEDGPTALSGMEVISFETTGCLVGGAPSRKSLVYNPANGKLMAFTAAGVEESAAAALSTAVYRVRIRYR